MPGRRKNYARYQHGNRQVGQWRSQRRTRRLPRRRNALILLLAAIVVCCFFTFRIRDISVSGAEIVPVAAVRERADDWLTGKHWMVFPNSAILSGGSRELENQLLGQLGLVAVHVHKRINGTLDIQVEESPVAAVVLFSDGVRALLSSDGRCLHQVAQLQAAQVSEALQDSVMTIHWPTTRPDACEDGFIVREHLSALSVFWGELRVAGEGMEPAYANPAYENLRDFDLVTTGGVIFSFSAESQIDDQVRKLRALLNERKTKEERGALGHVDLRFGDKIYLR
ncbi:MAG: hypothetical protein ABIG71_03975 [Candidatus Uhrbacteria bacterium]